MEHDIAFNTSGKNSKTKEGNTDNENSSQVDNAVLTVSDSSGRLKEICPGTNYTMSWSTDITKGDLLFQVSSWMFHL